MCVYSAMTPIAQQILQNIYKALVVHQFRIDVIDLVVEPTDGSTANDPMTGTRESHWSGDR